MRDIGVFTAKAVSSDKLIEFVRSYSSLVGQPYEKRSKESVVGKPPVVLYVSDETHATNGYFSGDEKEVIASKLGSQPEGYVSIHFSLGDDSFAIADRMAHEISRIWEGIIDYSGTGGDLRVPPTPDCP